mgnify:CR=1 FL=1
MSEDLNMESGHGGIQMVKDTKSVFTHIPLKIVYGSGGFGPTQAPEDAARRAVWYADKGYSAVKLRFEGNVNDIERLRKVREALPENIAIMGDAMCRRIYTVGSTNRQQECD